MKNGNIDNLSRVLKRREFLTMLAGSTVALMASGCLPGEEPTAAASASPTATTASSTDTALPTAAASPTATALPADRLGQLLPLRKLGGSGPAVTNLGVGGAHVGSASEGDAQAIIEKALEEGVRFFDNAPFYSGGRAEERYGAFLTPNYRDVAFVMTKTMARDGGSARRDLDNSLSRMKTDYVDLWQMHSLESPTDVETRIQNGVLDVFLEAQDAGKVGHIGFTGHSSYLAHVKMLDELDRLGVTATASQMPINPADPHYESFITHVVPRCVETGIGVLAMKTLADGRFFGGNRGWGRKNVSVDPIVPAILSVEDVLGFAWSLPITTLISGMESVAQVAQNAAMARQTWNWDQAELQARIDAVAAIAGPDLEFYKR